MKFEFLCLTFETFKNNHDFIFVSTLVMLNNVCFKLICVELLSSSTALNESLLHADNYPVLLEGLPFTLRDF